MFESILSSDKILPPITVAISKNDIFRCKVTTFKTMREILTRNWHRRPEELQSMLKHYLKKLCEGHKLMFLFRFPGRVEIQCLEYDQRRFVEID